MKPARLVFTLLAILLAGGLLPLRAESSTVKAEKKNYVHTLTLADRVRVAVYQEEDLTSLTRIDARGRINLPLLGEINIGGCFSNGWRDRRRSPGAQIWRS